MEVSQYTGNLIREYGGILVCHHPLGKNVVPGSSLGTRVTVANCRQSLNTAWLIMYSPHLRHLRERLAHGGRHASAVKQNLCCLLCSCLHNCQHVLALVYIDIRWQVLMLQLPVPMSQPTQLLYNRCVQSDCPSCMAVVYKHHLSSSPQSQLSKAKLDAKLYDNLIYGCVELQHSKTYGLTYAIHIHIYIYAYEKLQFNSLVLGLLMLVPINSILFYKVVVQFRYVP